MGEEIDHMNFIIYTDVTFIHDLKKVLKKLIEVVNLCKRDDDDV